MRTLAVMAVCTGNICRSALAEYVLRDAVERAGLGDRIQVTSSGISDEEEGRPMDPRMANITRSLGLDPSAHRARPMPHSAWETQDLFLAADLNHLRTLRRWAPTAEHREKIRLLRSFDPASANLPEEQLGMADPWYGCQRDFELTRDQVLASVPGVVDHLLSTLKGAQVKSSTPGTVRVRSPRIPRR
ncbi:MAG: low molecular weight protein-tyrosine-phosphatase [Galactobacter sp.]